MGVSVLEVVVEVVEVVLGVYRQGRRGVGRGGRGGHGGHGEVGWMVGQVIWGTLRSTTSAAILNVVKRTTSESLADRFSVKRKYK